MSCLAPSAPLLVSLALSILPSALSSKAVVIALPVTLLAVARCGNPQASAIFCLSFTELTELIASIAAPILSSPSMFSISVGLGKSIACIAAEDPGPVDVTVNFLTKSEALPGSCANLEACSPAALIVAALAASDRLPSCSTLLIPLAVPTSIPASLAFLSSSIIESVPPLINPATSTMTEADFLTAALNSPKAFAEAAAALAFSWSAFLASGDPGAGAAILSSRILSLFSLAALSAFCFGPPGPMSDKSSP